MKMFTNDQLLQLAVPIQETRESLESLDVGLDQRVPVSWQTLSALFQLADKGMEVVREEVLEEQ